MKHILFTLLIIIGSICATTAQTNNSAQMKAQAPVHGFFQALSDRNADSLRFYCTTDFTLLEDGMIWNTDTLVKVIEQIKGVADFKRINQFDFFETRIEGNIAWLNYHNEADITRNGKRFKIQWLESVILLKKNKRWLIAQMHSTFVKRTNL